MGPVAFAAVAFNIPKFIENEIHTDANGTSQIQIADRRIQHDYMLYYTFSLIAHPTLTTGIAPMVALIFMNIKIFQGKHIRYIVSAMEWIKNRLANNFKQSATTAILAVVISASMTTVDPLRYKQEETALFGQNQKELFEYVTNAEEFHEVSILNS